jgi:hypothetical protein
MGAGESDCCGHLPFIEGCDNSLFEFLRKGISTQKSGEETGEQGD